MLLLFYFIIFFIGIAVGSFLNCVIYRLEKGESFLRGRSYCPHCRHQLSWKDLVPLLSFLLLRGRCRYCREKISWQYPLMEMATAMLFLLIFNFQFLIVKEGFTLFSTFTPINGSSAFNQFSIIQFLNLIYLWTIVSFLIIIFVYDLKHYIIPDKVIYPAIALALIFNFKFLIFISSILSATGASAFFLAIFLVSKGRAMGFGDVKLAFFMGLFLGFPKILAALFLAFSLGAMIGIGLILAKKKNIKSEVPFGPFLALGTIAALFWGEKLINWYLATLSFQF